MQLARHDRTALRFGLIFLHAGNADGARFAEDAMPMARCDTLIAARRRRYRQNLLVDLGKPLNRARTC